MSIVFSQFFKSAFIFLKVSRKLFSLIFPDSNSDNVHRTNGFQQKNIISYNKYPINLLSIPENTSIIKGVKLLKIYTIYSNDIVVKKL